VIQHHPDDSTLLQYATGALPEALNVVLATHLTYCAVCRQAVAHLETIGGIILEEIEPEPMSNLPVQPSLIDWQSPIVNHNLPAPLNRTPLGSHWWPIGVGLYWRRLRVAGSAWGGLIWGKPGAKLPRHRHVGLELTCVLEGSFTDSAAEYFAGDISDPEEGDHSDPPITITGSQPCLCALATEGMHLRGVLGFVQRTIGWMNGPSAGSILCGLIAVSATQG
jgi:putative transcriptional regulator